MGIDLYEIIVVKMKIIGKKQVHETPNFFLTLQLSDDRYKPTSGPQEREVEPTQFNSVNYKIWLV